MEVEVKDSGGNVVGNVELDERVWNAPSNDTLLHQVVVAQLSNRRHGTSESKTRAQVSYSTRKLRQQKHSGRARLGSRKSPTMVGGGTIFGPHSRSYRKRVPKKMRQQALRVALSDKVREDRLTVLDEIEFASPRTKDMVVLMDRLGCIGRRTLLITSFNDRNVVLSSRGVPKLDVVFADMINATLATRATNLVVTRAAVERIVELWGNGSDNGSEDEMEVGE